jgi:hypothetical protein
MSTDRLGLSPDAHWLVRLQGTATTVFNLHTATPMAEFPGTSRVAFSADGSLAAGATGIGLAVCTLADEKLMIRISTGESPQPLVYPNAFCLSDDGAWLASFAEHEGKLKLWRTDALVREARKIAGVRRPDSSLPARDPQ